MVRRLIDIVLSASALILLSPLLATAAMGILVASPGPVLFRARRMGLKGKVFTMYKFRTMHIQHAFHSSITAEHDPRVFSFGRWLRRLKVDELPQLFNIFKGEMSIVGPRPEDPLIVWKYYRFSQLETLNVLPGLASPGSIYNYTHGARILDNDEPEKYYIEQLLPIKVALDLVYVREASWLYDLQIVFRTVITIIAIATGKRRFTDPPEMRKAKQLIVSVAY